MSRVADGPLLRGGCPPISISPLGNRELDVFGTWGPHRRSVRGKRVHAFAWRVPSGIGGLVVSSIPRSLRAMNCIELLAQPRLVP